MVVTDTQPPLKHRGGLAPSYATAEQVEIFNMNMMVRARDSRTIATG
jgi:hypothetical protein